MCACLKQIVKITRKVYIIICMLRVLGDIIWGGGRGVALGFNIVVCCILSLGLARLESLVKIYIVFAPSLHMYVHTISKQRVDDFIKCSVTKICVLQNITGEQLTLSLSLSLSLCVYERTALLCDFSLTSSSKTPPPWQTNCHHSFHPFEVSFHQRCCLCRCCSPAPPG